MEKPCKMILNTRMGQCSEPLIFSSISAAIRFAKGSGYFRYRIFVEGKLWKQGYCER